MMDVERLRQWVHEACERESVQSAARTPWWRQAIQRWEDANSAQAEADRLCAHDGTVPMCRTCLEAW